MLAGGLTAENVRAAIQTSGAKAVDVSSGVESSTGVKSTALIRAFIQAVKAP
jgi:phosphoribosylanthranilate isomerase